MPQQRLARRGFLGRAGKMLAAAGVFPRLIWGEQSQLSNPVGYATLTWPKDELAAALRRISSLKFQGVQFLGWVSEKYGNGHSEELQTLLKNLDLQPVALSCSRLGLHPGGSSLDTDKMRGYVDFFRKLGGRYLQVIDGGRPGASYSKADIQGLGERMNQLGKIAADSGLTLGYHPHFGTLGETREGLGRVLDATDPGAVKLIVDVAHIVLGGADPAEVIRTYHDRVIFCHFKDVQREIWELAQKDRNLIRGKRCLFSEIGTGQVDFGPVLTAFREVGFRGWVIVELDPCKELAGGPDGAASRNQEAIRKLGFNI